MKWTLLGFGASTVNSVRPDSMLSQINLHLSQNPPLHDLTFQGKSSDAKAV